MIVIEGYAGKSVIVKEFLETSPISALVIDTHGGMRNAYYDRDKIRATIYQTQVEPEKLEAKLQEIKDTGFFKEVNTVLFYANDTRDNIGYYQELGKRFGFSTAVTIQIPASEVEGFDEKCNTESSDGRFKAKIYLV